MTIAVPKIVYGLSAKANVVADRWNSKADQLCGNCCLEVSLNGKKEQSKEVHNLLDIIKPL